MYYRPQQQLQKGNVFISICHSVNRGVSASGSRGIHPQTPPWADTPLRTDPSHLQRQPLQQTVHILLECILVKEPVASSVFVVIKLETFGIQGSVIYSHRI